MGRVSREVEGGEGCLGLFIDFRGVREAGVEVLVGVEIQLALTIL